MAKVIIDMEVESVGSSRRIWDTRIDDEAAAYIYSTYLDLLVAWGNAKLSGALTRLGPNPSEADALEAALKVFDE